VTTAAGFIRAWMPPGGERLNAEDAFDVAAYVNSFERPHTADLHLDYPVLSEKPVDCPYPPYPDRFPVYRHKYGPFAEIAAAARARGTGEPGR
jgi:thiosulfate dehydrogenase